MFSIIQKNKKTSLKYRNPALRQGLKMCYTKVNEEFRKKEEQRGRRNEEVRIWCRRRRHNMQNWFV